MSLTAFEKSQEGQHAYNLPRNETDFEAIRLPKDLLRKQSIALPEMSELSITRHFSSLAKLNMGVDTNFYPLGSCTMKFNPRVNEYCSQLPGFTRTHPLAPDDTVQGNLYIIHEMISLLCGIAGMTAGTLLPSGGAQGEFTGIRMIDAYHRHRGDFNRKEVLIPDNAHGTNPATATMAGFRVIPIKTNSRGDLDLEQLKSLVSPHTAGLMLTNPNTLGLFSPIITEIADIVHQAGGLLYYDGANLNSILNIAKPGKMGFDVMHINVHKTFGTPHGGGGPGAGPVLCNDKLKSFLPIPYVKKQDDHYKVVWESAESIGQMVTFFGSFDICLRAFSYIQLNGNYGLRHVAEIAVLNANYLKKKLKHLFTIPFSQSCMHEFAIQADNYLDYKVRALDIAKRLLDYGIYAPTIYFPLIIKECMLIEPTETESLATLDYFVEVMEKIVDEIKTNAEVVKTAPHLFSVSRLDDVHAVKFPILKHATSES